MEIFSPKYRFLYELDTGTDPQKLKELFQLLSEKQKRDVAPQIEEKYQQVHFASPADQDLYQMKLAYKDILLQVSDMPQQKALLQNTLYDLKDSM